MRHRNVFVLIGLAFGACGESGRLGSIDFETDTTSLHGADGDTEVQADTAAPRRPRDARYDFDGDGHADLIVGDPTYRGGRGALWLIRAGEGRPHEPILIAQGEPDERLGRFVFPVSDQDGDGRFEIGSYHTADELVWRGRWFATGGGQGTFPSPDSSEWYHKSITAVVSADLDSDTAPDLIVSYTCGERCRGWVKVTGNGVEPGNSLQAPVVVEAPGTAGFGITVAEKTPDSTSCESSSAGSALPPCRLSLSYRGTSRLLLSRFGHVATIGDVDGDGEADLMVGTRPSTVLMLGTNDVRTDESSCAVALGDWDCDGFDDIATWGPMGCEVDLYGWPQGDATHWRAGSADGPATEAPLPAGWSPTLIHPDLDLDGCRDEALHGDSGSYTIARGRRGEAPLERWPLTLPVSIGRANHLMDLDEVVWARSPYAEPAAFRHDGERMVGVDAFPGELSTFGDVDGDGLTDAIEMRDGEAFFWRGRGTTLENTVHLPRFETAIIGDLDGDGDDEVVQYDFFGPVIRRGGNKFPDEGLLVSSLGTDGRANGLESIGDVDGDGRADLSGYKQSAESLETRVWLGRDLAMGNGGLSTSYPFGGRFSRPGDIDGDGLDDLVLLDQPAVGVVSLSVHLGRPGLPPDPERWELSFSDRPIESFGPHGLVLSANPEGTTLEVFRATPDGLVEHTTITAPVSVRNAHFQARLLVLPWADEDGAHVYRVRDGALVGPTLITLPKGEPASRPLAFSPRLWAP